GPVSIKDWRPQNYTGRYLGPITLREAFAKSSNTASVKISEKIGRQKVINAAKRLGITSKITSHPSIALGTAEASLLEMTAAYAIFSNKGFPSWPYGIIEIQDSTNKVLYRRRPVRADPLVSKDTLKSMQSMLVNVVKTGTGTSASFDRPAAGKTGTSQGFRDAWFIGFTAELATGVWLGNDDSSPMKNVSGGSAPAKMWRKFMMDALQGESVRHLPRP
ncbi:MAG: hypothetical protein CMM75_00400, partial [Rhodospirillaceae bacterium]|nr:hypothetical protein [Rhodospirillaceae bacterium]